MASWFQRNVLNPIGNAFSGRDDDYEERQLRAHQEGLRNRNAAMAQQAQQQAQYQDTQAALQQTLAQQTEQTRIANDRAAETAAAALKATQDAEARAAAAAVPLRDSETARRSAETRKRKLSASGGAFSSNAGRTFGAPPVGFAALSGY